MVGDVVGLDHLPPMTGSDCSPAARLLDETVRDRGLAQTDVYAGDILTFGHPEVDCIGDPADTWRSFVGSSRARSCCAPSWASTR